MTDELSEVIYVLDQNTGDFWSLTPKPCGHGNYIVRHGFGYTVFESEYKGIKAALTLFTTEKDPVKISYIKFHNTNAEVKRLRLFYYVEPVMGVSSHVTTQYITTSVPETPEGTKGINAIFIKNSFADEQKTGKKYDYGYYGETAFIAASGKKTGYTGDRLTFLGLNGGFRHPAAVLKGELDNRVGGGLPPCAALSADLNINPGESASQIFLFGEGENSSHAVEIIKKYINSDTVQASLDSWKNFWINLLTTFQVSTPDQSLNLMLNGWLLYQTISCRMMARSAFYQSGGAFGFRDQLQDSMAVIYTKPEFTREQILIHCRHQFIEGDVQHWWHEPDGKGIRSRYSDDLLWLPYVVSEYIEKYGDTEILNEVEPYLKSPVLEEDEHERYEVPSVSQESGIVYDHCIRAIEQALRFGERGLPLIGGGDWNDGMNMVGHKGKGESVWLAWF